MTFSMAKFQIGKNGINPGVIDSLYLVLKNHKQVRISLLKSSGRDRESIRKIADDIVTNLESKKEFSLDYKIIGFTLVMSKHTLSKERKKK